MLNFLNQKAFKTKYGYFIGMPSKKTAIKFVLTGGTIDSYYDGSIDTVVPHKNSVIPKYLKSLNLYEKIDFEQVCMKDSRGLNQNDLKNILKAVQSSSHKKIIITHGTYTLSTTSRYLKAKLKSHDKTIIFTGAMIPLEGFTNSDALFNLGFSIAEVQRLPPGIYVCMNGNIFDPDEIMKLISRGKFVSLFNEK